MSTTTTDHFEVYVDPTFISSSDRFDDVLAPPRGSNRLERDALFIPPSELPAFELPDWEPTADDLLAIEHGTDEDRFDERIDTANSAAAVEARKRDLIRLRAELSVAVLDDEQDLERAA